MQLFFIYFTVFSCFLIPFAYFAGIVDKITNLKPEQPLIDKILNNFCFIPLGIPILCLDTIADIYYFWVNNFRSDEKLKRINIPKEKTSISHKSIREITKIIEKFNFNQIKTINAHVLVKTFIQAFNVISNIQFLMFG